MKPVVICCAVREKIGAIATPDYIQNAPGLPKTRSGKCSPDAVAYVTCAGAVCGICPVVLFNLLLYIIFLLYISCWFYSNTLQVRSCDECSAKSPAMSETWATSPHWLTRQLLSSSFRTDAAPLCDSLWKPCQEAPRQRTDSNKHFWTRWGWAAGGSHVYNDPTSFSWKGKGSSHLCSFGRHKAATSCGGASDTTWSLMSEWNKSPHWLKSPLIPVVGPDDSSLITFLNLFISLEIVLSSF